ncbi:MAG: hypothetical protein ACI4SF_12765 [Oscillospiraceae bacterium]
MVKTVTLTAGTPVKVKFLESYPFCWIDNKTSGDVYASVGGTPEADKDGTYTITAGSQLRISGGAFSDNLTLLGEGKVQVIASGIASCPFKSAQGGGGVKYINGIAAVNGMLALTQSLIPSDGTAYQFPYYTQSGTVTVDSNTYKGISITFPKAFKEVPLLLLAATYNKPGTAAAYLLIANYGDLTESGFTLAASAISTSGLNAASCAGTVTWFAFGAMEEDTDG